MEFVSPETGLLEFGAADAELAVLRSEFGIEFAGVEPAEELAAVASALLEPEVTPASVGLLSLAEFVEPPALGLMVNSSFTCFTPVTDLATSLARFLSALAGTEPVIVAVPFETETNTLMNAGS